MERDPHGRLESLLLRLPERLDPIVLWLQDRSGRTLGVLAVGVVAVLVAGIAYAGGLIGGDSADEMAEAAIARTITEAFSNDPASCELATDRFLAERFDTSGDETPLEDCREQAEDHQSLSEATVSVGSIEVGESGASASIAVTGGSYGGAQMALQLVNQNGWKVDAIASAELDLPRFLDAQRAAADQESPMEATLLHCVLDWVEGNVPVETLNSAITTGSDEYFLGAAGACVGPARALFVAGVRRAVAARGAPVAVTRCIANQVRIAMTDADLQAAFEASIQNRPPPIPVLRKAAQVSAVCASAGVGQGGAPSV